MATKEAAQEEKEIQVSKHIFVPRHNVLGKDEKTELLKKFNIAEHQLPKINVSDPAAKETGAKSGDVIKITRASQTAGKTVYYRLVVGAAHAE